MIKQKIFSTAIIVLEAVLLIGVFTFLAPCPIKEHIMGCHWVANVSAGISSVVIFLSLAAVIAGSALTRKGLNLAVLSISVLHALVPQVLISICAHEQMRCQIYTQPAIVAVASLVFLLAAAELFITRSR